MKTNSRVSLESIVCGCARSKRVNLPPMAFSCAYRSLAFLVIWSADAPCRYRYSLYVRFTTQAPLNASMQSTNLWASRSDAAILSAATADEQIQLQNKAMAMLRQTRTIFPVTPSAAEPVSLIRAPKVDEWRDRDCEAPRQAISPAVLCTQTSRRKYRQRT